MRQFKRHFSLTRQQVKPKSRSCMLCKSCTITGVPEGYKVENVFLTKNGVVVFLCSSDLIQLAEQGSLHIERTESYTGNN